LLVFFVTNFLVVSEAGAHGFLNIHDTSRSAGIAHRGSDDDTDISSANEEVGNGQEDEADAIANAIEADTEKVNGAATGSNNVGSGTLPVNKKVASRDAQTKFDLVAKSPAKPAEEKMAKPGARNSTAKPAQKPAQELEIAGADALAAAITMSEEEPDSADTSSAPGQATLSLATKKTAASLAVRKTADKTVETEFAVAMNDAQSVEDEFEQEVSQREAAEKTAMNGRLPKPNQAKVVQQVSAALLQKSGAGEQEVKDESQAAEEETRELDKEIDDIEVGDDSVGIDEDFGGHSNLY
jgi:hypothetical protein